MSRMKHEIELIEKEKVWFWITAVAGLMISSVCYVMTHVDVFCILFYVYGTSLIVLATYEFIKSCINATIEYKEKRKGDMKYESNRKSS